jgi:hypothetical protein
MSIPHPLVRLVLTALVLALPELAWGQMEPAYSPTPLVDANPERLNGEQPGEREIWSEEFSEEGDEEEDELVTDRDSFTPATTLAGRRHLIVETAYTFLDNRRVPETHSLPELLVRYGVNDWLELRFATNYEVGGAGNPVSANSPDDLAEEAELEEEANVSYGLKLALRAQNGWTPRSALILQGATPTAGVATDTHFHATYVTGWTLQDGWTWDSSIRVGTGSLEDDRFQVWAPSSVVKFPLSERWKGHVEYFGVFSEGRARETTQHFFSPGAHVMLTEDFEVGVRVGWGLNDQSPNFFANVGGGYRF